MEIVTLSIGVGILFGFLLWERTGLYSGGWVVPGYVALFLFQPWVLGSLVLSSILTFSIYKISESHFLSFGQRKTVLILLLSVFVSMLVDFFTVSHFGSMRDIESKTISHIVPGLIALTFEKQGIPKTFSSILICSVLVRLFLILVLGDVLLS
ncbi:poly-gamma-glutamate biosynthesis protein PgsC [Leptospira barantonii]|uniref:Poly-gamma-glutamate biosynthesis protein PgsC n=1 Tax=Leptospira barantonii TaxID=2023184 RepID=A0A5F2BNV7_9LEPT|nr:poly-gamma-glutamate biosynthesis protein PgsC [Leptospira barantonii]TGM07243.1 poly-gamma-glutamate biosynthesis protein PgsC [Leptospira barantonii]